MSIGFDVMFSFFSLSPAAAVRALKDADYDYIKYYPISNMDFELPNTPPQWSYKQYCWNMMEV